MQSKKTLKKGLQTHISYVNLSSENMTVQRREYYMKIVGERMRQLREEAGISQNKLAKLIGILQSSLNRGEKLNHAVAASVGKKSQAGLSAFAKLRSPKRYGHGQLGEAVGAY